MSRWIVWPIVTLLIAVACSTLPTSPPSWRVYNPIRWTPLEQFSAEYKRVSVCTGRTGSYEAIRWHIADSIKLDDGRHAGGLWVYPDDIYLPLVFSWETVRHEMTHHQLQRGGHPLAYFPKCSLEENLPPLH